MKTPDAISARSFPGNSLLRIFFRRAEVDPQRPALAVKQNGEFRWISWAALRADVLQWAWTLRQCGVQAGDRVAQLSENRWEWVVSDLAIHLLAAIHVPLHASLASEQVAEQLNHSEACWVLVSSSEQAAKLHAHRSRLSGTLRGFCYEPCGANDADARLNLLTEQFGQAPNERETNELFTRAVQEVDAAAPATILYTSGTSGEPKGVVLSQANLVANAMATAWSTGEARHDIKLCFLPLSHSYARTCDMYTWMVCGNRLAMAGSRSTILQDCAAIRPTFLNGVPRFYDNVCRELQISGREPGAGALRDLLGGRIASCQCGGAAISQETFDLFWSQGVPLFTGYGLTEASPVISVSNPRQIRFGAVGRPLCGVDVDVAADDEILTRGPHVMRGYWQDPVATGEVLDAGWLKTGDLGFLDNEGLLHITGRKKELIVTSSGHNIAPARLEGCITADPLIEQAIVIGDGRDFLVALLVPRDATSPAAADLSGKPDDAQGSDAATPEDTAAEGFFLDRICQRLVGFSPHEQIRAVAVLDSPFSVEGGELTSKLSLRRHVISERYASRIDAMYVCDRRQRRREADV